MGINCNHRVRQLGLASTGLVLLCLFALPARATQWQAIKKTSERQLMIDKHSIVQQTPYTKAWIKVEYRTPQKNMESVDRVYTHARALWAFDCASRKAATLQVFQYDQQELIYAAGIDLKQADFVEPLPESEVEMAEHYVCQKQQSDQLAREKSTADKSTADKSTADKSTSGKPISGKSSPDKVQADAADTPLMRAVASTPAVTANPVVSDTPQALTQAQKKPLVAANNSDHAAPSPPANPHKAVDAAAATQQPSAPAKPATGQHNPANSTSQKTTMAAPATSQPTDWQYNGDRGPEHWANLHPAFVTCGSGSQQSPILLDTTIQAALKPLKRLQKFPLKSIRHDGHGLWLDAGSGNMLVLDQKPYQMKQLQLHFPAEHQIRQQHYAGELQMLHSDKAGHQVMLSVLLESGTVSHPAIDKLLAALPAPADTAKPLPLRLTPAELMPVKPAYYRYSGSLTTPPCSEGVQWLVMKEPLKLSPQQLDKLRTATGAANQRPVQDAQGRIVLE